jgi:hypothetical protein
MFINFNNESRVCLHMNNTTNYNLNLPSGGDSNWNNPLNENFETIDTEMKEIDNKIGDLSSLGVASTVEKFNKVDSSLADIVTINFVKDCGGVGDGVTDNTNAFVTLSSKVNLRGGNCTILFPHGIYKYTPSFATNAQWRATNEFVDVVDVVINGYGATIKQVKDDLWTTATSNGNQEGAINFRSSGHYTCKKIRINGLKLQGDRVPYNVSSDGNIFGIALRGVDDVVIRDVESNGWGTDGIYVGTTYGNTYKSRNVIIQNPVCDNNTRQGISIAGCDNIKIIEPTITNTNGGSFGHGIDFEANAPQVNYGVRVQGGYFYNNQRGALNFINTQNARIIGCDIHEPISNGSIYADGASKDIDISLCTIISSQATFYQNGSELSDFRFHHNVCTTTDKPNNNATIRINTNNSYTALNEIRIQDNKFIGTGGIAIKADGKIYIERNKFLVSKQNSTDANCFDLQIEADCNFVGNEIEISSDVVFTEKFVYVTKGIIKDNRFISNDTAKCYICDNRGNTFVNGNLVIGRNVFSPNFYYKAENSNLNLTTEATVVEFYGGRYGGSVYRRVHGGYSRVLYGINNQRGDVTFSGSESYGWYYDSNGNWNLIQQTIGIGSSAARPSSLGAQYRGLHYLDTTLSVNGKLIIWNGTAWVDSTGTLV